MINLFFLCLFLFIQTSFSYIKMPVLTSAGEIWDLYAYNDIRDILALTDDWLVVPYIHYPRQKVSFCYTWYFLGGPGISSSIGYFERTYTDLPTHNLAYYSIPIRMIGTWDATDSFSIIIDDILLSTWTTNNYPASTCSSFGLVRSVGGKVVHSASTLTLKIAFNIYSSNASPASLIVKDVYFSFRNSTETSLVAKWSAAGGCPSGSSSCTCTSNCQVCFGNGANQCARCNWGKSDYGSGCGSCTSHCLLCSGSVSNQCSLCDVGYTVTLDGTCLASCPSDSVTMTNGRYSFCIDPCPTGQYMMWNWTCGASCDAPLTQTASTPTTYCSYPCDQENGEYLYWDGTCSSTCTYTARNESWYYFCDACPQGYWSYENTSCLSTCQLNFDQTTVGGSSFCTYPCASSEFLYPNGSCLTTCQLDFSQRTEGTFKFCDYPCQLSEYLYLNGSCLSTCQTYFNVSLEGTYQFCDFPCASSEYLYLDGTCSLTCKKYYIKYTEQSVLNFCDYPCTTAGYWLDEDGTCITTSTLSNGTQAVLSGSQKAGAILTQATSLLTSGSAISISAAFAGRIFFNIKYLNISYSEELQEALETWSQTFISAGLTPNLPQSVINKIPSRHVPYVFAKYSVPSSFILNYYESLGMLVIILIAIISFKILEIFINFLNKTNSFLGTFNIKCKIMAQNFFIATLYGVYGDLVLYAILEYRSIQFHFDLSLLSFIISVLFLIVMLTCFFLHFMFLQKYQAMKKQSSTDDSEEFLENFTKNYPALQVLYKDYSDKTLDRQMLLIRLTLRDLLFSFIITLLFDYPLIQVTVFCISSFFFIFILIDRKPFRNKFDLFQQIYFELIGLSVNISVLLNFVNSNDGTTSTSTVIKNIGKFIIAMNMMYNFSLAALMFLQIFLLAYEQWQAYQQKQKKAIIRVKIHRRLNESSISLNPINIDQSVVISETQGQPALDISIIGNLNSEENILRLPRAKSINHKRRRVI